MMPERSGVNQGVNQGTVLGQNRPLIDLHFFHYLEDVEF